MSKMLSSAANGTNSLLDFCVQSLLEHADKRSKSWFLCKSPWQLFTILAAYLFFCLYAGPRFMRNRKPFELKNALLVYNALQVVLSCVMFYEFYKGGWDGQYSFRCEPITYGTDPISMRMARAVWLYYIAKISELFDTVFFVLRKRDRQISFLHIYHHTAMPIFSFVGVQNFAGGHGTITCFVNSFVHIVMYTYYMLSAMGPRIQKLLWWKKYITVMQIPNCDYSKIAGGIITANAALFTYMFSSFYVRNYNVDQKHATLKRDTAAAVSVLKQD